MNTGSRICSCNVTSSSHKATWWLARLPYDVIFMQEHHGRFKKEFATTLLSKAYNVVFPPAKETMIDRF
eukprot:4222371-Karenia_brevis.AAC.1